MTSLLQSIRSEGAPLSFAEFQNYFKFGGLNYGLLGTTPQTLGSKIEEIEPTFTGYAQGMFKANPVVFGCCLARLSVFSEARFQFRRRVDGRPGELFGTQALEPLEKPWPGGTTGKLLTRMIGDSDIAGNWFGALIGGKIRRLRPDWVTIILGSQRDPDAGIGHPDIEPVGYIYTPGGRGGKSYAYLPEQVAHFAPVPDPVASFRGMSWMTPVLREVMADQMTTEHKLKFLEQGATPNMVVTLDAAVQREEFERWVALFKEEHGTDLASAYKTLFLGAGADAKVVGSDLRKADFKSVQAIGENRIAVAAGVPGVIAGLSEGLESSTYSNFGQARRRFADGTIRFLWREAAGALAPLVEVPSGAELWYDDRDIPFLQEDRKDEAEIQQAEAVTIKTLIEAGYDPDSAVAAVAANDMTRLTHTGMVSVQLQKPGLASGNGNGQTPAPSAA